jgi:chromosomal replication initiator protein
MREPSLEADNEKKEVWAQCLAILREKLGTPTFETFFKSSYPVSLQNNRLKIAVPNKFTKERIESRFMESIKEALNILEHQKVQLEFAIDETLEASPHREEQIELPRYQHTSLNSKFTFDTFVVGASNHFAHAAALAVAEAPAKAYNPFFIYGGVGLGKTHLIHAIAHHVLKKWSHLKVVYLSAERFTNEFIECVQKNTIDQFRKRYRNADVLLIDDIQLIVGKERTQVEFFHTFNELHGAQKQIVISSDRPPKQLPTLEDRLKSRFEWGLIADVQTPDLETREAILRKKAELDNVHIPHDVISFIAERVPSNIRELEGTLNRVIAFCSVKKIPITLQSCQEALKDIFHTTSSKHISIPVIQQVVANYFGVTVEELKAAKRDQRVVKPRQIAMYLCREITGASFPYIGEEFGSRDHTTVLHAYAKIQNMLNDPTMANILKNISDQIQAYGA